MTDGLLAEVERVIYELHSPTEREGAISFNDLRDIRSERYREARRREEESLGSLSERINTELEKRSLVPQLTTQVQEKDSLVKRLCEILEGGETAFKKRARRLRVRLSR
ncbi:hypothetical protein HBB04_00209 [Pseudomonas coronafaciens]|nr:hypothetical protein HBB04_00209 [Pseudomonas coronafaciens]